MSPQDDLGTFVPHARALKTWLRQYPPPPENRDEDLDPLEPID